MTGANPGSLAALLVSDPTRQRSVWRGAIVLAIAGLVLTGVMTWASYSSNQNSNTALLRLDVRQVASSIRISLTTVQGELSDALNEASSTNSVNAFKAFVMPQVGGASGFASESLWARNAYGYAMVAVVGKQPQLVLDGKTDAFFSSLRPKDQLQVTGILPGSAPRVGYAEFPSGGSQFIVYAESQLPPGRRLVVTPSSPFGQLDYAAYLGRGAHEHDLLATSIPTPITGLSAMASVPFGNTFLTIVATPRTQLSSPLSGNLPWIVLGVGLVLSLAGALAVATVTRRRLLAEALAERLRTLHAEQRSIASTLQHALLPESLPEVAGLELAARYVPGAEGLEIGGDWYDFIALKGGQLVFVIGDVSGRGVRAASMMASLRFASQGFAYEGHGPAAIIDHLRPLLEFGQDGYFATVLCGSVNAARTELVVASAGHPPPVLCTEDGAITIEMTPAPPIGVAADEAPAPTMVAIPPSATLVAYTDGLIERRGESLQDGIDRLETSLVNAEAGSLDEVLSSILVDLTHNAPGDDVAMIGIKWVN